MSAARPSSLVLAEGAPAPEKEPLRFDVNLVGAPPEVEQLVNNIKQVAEEFLYHWKTFPIVLPSSRFAGPGSRPCDLLVAPPCDELDAAALDAGSEPHPLSPKQLHSIRDKGEFEVPSRHFPGQTHVWRVAGWLQRGRARARDELYSHLARSAALLVVVARERLLRDEPLSVRAGLRQLLQGLERLLDLAFGMPSLAARDLDRKIREERSRYLVAELICKSEYREEVSALAAWVTRAMRRAAAEKPDAREPGRAPPPVPHLYTTPQRTQVDLRLYRRDVMRRAAGPLQAVLERESRGWFLHFRERLAAQLARQKVPPQDIEEEVRVAGMREYVSRVCAAVRASAELRAIGEGVPELLAEQLQATVIMNRAEEAVRRKIAGGSSCTEARLAASHPVLCRVRAWREERVRAHARRLAADLAWAAHEDAAAACAAHKLLQHRYFLLRDLAFLRERQPLLLKELRNAKTPTREYCWPTRIWLPQNWTVRRHFRGRSEPIPTVLSARATSIVTPRSDPSQPVFLVSKESVHRSNTRWPGWRWLNYCHRTWCWCWNTMFLLGVVVPWCSPLSLRTLFCVEPFIPDLELSQVNGTLFPKKSSETHSMWSRLLALWRHVSKERTRFETEPDTGLLGKGLSRQKSRVWWCGVVGGLGSVALLLLLPLVVLATSALSLAAALTVPLWLPPLTLAAHAAALLVYDLDCPDPARLNRWCALGEAAVWRVGVLGVLQPLLALVVALVLCPLAALLLLAGGVAWWAVRGVWEGVMWRAVIARAARVPAHDSTFCRRVAGPGLHSRFYYQITSWQALAAMCARMELEELAAWAARAEAAIDKPLRDYRQFVNACFGPFSVQIAKSGAYKQLEKECVELTASLREKVESRRRELQLGLSDAVRARVKMTQPDLRRAVWAGAREAARVWAGGARGDEWWAARGLTPSDWHALAAHLLSEVFDAEVLVALSEGEARLRLEPGESGDGTSRWEELAARGEPDAQPDVLGEWSEWGASPAPRVPPPHLDVAAFNPRAPAAAGTGASVLPALQPPPVPPPATVALVLHDRDADAPIPLDSELCSDILRTLEEAAPDTDDRKDGVSRFRGGGGGSRDECTSDSGSCESVWSGASETAGARAACRWTLTGWGARRVRVDLASPEDVTLDADSARVRKKVWELDAHTYGISPITNNYIPL